MTTDPLLSVTNLMVAFGSHAIVEDLSFKVNQGDGVAIIGPNGAGKTVLLKALLGLIPYRGEIRWSQGVRLGYVPQKIVADRQLPLSARDFLSAKVRFLKLPGNELDRVSTELNLTEQLLDANVGTLSGGQFQKVLIAFALLADKLTSFVLLAAAASVLSVTAGFLLNAFLFKLSTAGPTITIFSAFLFGASLLVRKQ